MAGFAGFFVGPCRFFWKVLQIFRRPCRFLGRLCTLLEGAANFWEALQVCKVNPCKVLWVLENFWKALQIFWEALQFSMRPVGGCGFCGGLTNFSEVLQVFGRFCRFLESLANLCESLQIFVSPCRFLGSFVDSYEFLHFIINFFEFLWGAFQISIRIRWLLWGLKSFEVLKTFIWPQKSL